jgi:hypothetical protein
MSERMIRTIVITGLAILCAPIDVDVAAQRPAARQAPAQPRNAVPDQGANPPDADSISVAELTAALDAYALVQAQQQLQISDDKYTVFAARLKRLQTVRRTNQRVRMRLVQDLRRLSGARANPPGDDAAIKAALTALRDHDERAAAELRQAYDALDQVLDVRQQARFRLFEELIEQRKLELLVRAQRARQGRKPPS